MYLISGIIVFSFFTECVTLGMDAIVMNASLITKVAIPKLIFPFSRALSSLINFLISLLPLLLLTCLPRRLAAVPDEDTAQTRLVAALALVQAGMVVNIMLAIIAR